MASLGGGVAAGVKDVRVIFIFPDPQVMRRFVAEGWQFGGEADAAAKYQDAGISAEPNARGNMSFHDGTVAAGSSTDLRAGTKRSEAVSPIRAAQFPQVENQRAIFMDLHIASDMPVVGMHPQDN
jgi:lipid-binding SYLF domain-containing protein